MQRKYERRKSCVFCGERPVEKSREHVLPQWLIGMTGDPTRKWIFAYDYNKERPIEFALQAFTFPACVECNNDYATFEGRAKDVVTRVCKKEPMKAGDYVFLMDWLDKVRVGVWLGQLILQNNPLSVSPKFSIVKRMAAKDRMIAVYTIGDHQTGMSVHGMETLGFQAMPSAFVLRIKNIALLNCSWDWMCSRRIGFPYPRVVTGTESGQLATSDYRRNLRIHSPVMEGLIKSCVTLYQPILQADVDGRLILSEVDNEFCKKNSWPQRNYVGALFRQLDEGVSKIQDPEKIIEFDGVSDWKAKPAGEIMAQAYSFQNIAMERSILDRWKVVLLQGANNKMLKALHAASRSR